VRAVTPSAADFSIEPRVEKHRYRGQDFTFTELTVAELDRLTKLATANQTDEDTGTTREVLDTALQSRLIVQACCGIPVAAQKNLPGRISNQINRVVSAMHYAEEPDELTDVEGDSEGNG
jgi:hypothetical protein